MMRKLALALVLASLPLAGCVYQEVAPTPVDPFPRLTLQKANPQLALFDHLLFTYFSRDISSSLTVCAAMQDGRSEASLDPEDEIALMTRFPTLAPLSRCSLRDGAWQDSESGEPALVFTVHNFTCASEQKCSGWAGYQAGSAGSTSDLYRMEWASSGSGSGSGDDGAQWSFTRDPMLIAE